MERNRTYVGIDLGGTSIQTAAVRDGEVLAEEKTKTKAELGPDGVIERIAQTVRAVREELDDPQDVAGICIGAPGTFDAATGLVRTAPNLGWTNVPLAERLTAAVGLPVVVDNDVNVGAAGEHVHGAGRGTLHMAAIFVGTGIGGALILGGRSHSGFRGAAAEFGHLVAVADGRPCPCGRQGCFEAYASKRAMESIVREKVSEGRRSAVLEIMDDKGKKAITSSVIEAALEVKDAVMIEVVQQAQTHLGVLTANVVNAFDPQVVVFGGGVVERLGDAFVDPIATEAREHFLQREGADQVRIVPAALGDHAGTIGAAVVAQRRFAGG